MASLLWGLHLPLESGPWEQGDLVLYPAGHCCGFRRVTGCLPPCLGLHNPATKDLNIALTVGTSLRTPSSLSYLVLYALASVVVPAFDPSTQKAETGR